LETRRRKVYKLLPRIFIQQCSIYIKDDKISEEDILKLGDLIIKVVIKFLHLDRFVVAVIINQTKNGWNVHIYHKNKKKVMDPLNRLFHYGKKRKNPDTDRDYEIKNFKLLYIHDNKLWPVGTKAKNLLVKLKNDLHFLISFSDYYPKKKSEVRYIFIYLTTIKKDIIIEDEKQKLREIISEYLLDSKQLKSYIKQFTGMKEQEFKEKLGSAILCSK